MLQNIALIPDGARRYAQREGIDLETAYLHTSEHLVRLCEALSKRGLKNIHIYSFSIHNLKRAPTEVFACLNAGCEFIRMINKAELNVQMHGDLMAIANTHPELARLCATCHGYFFPKFQTTIHLYIGYSLGHYLATLQNTYVNQEELRSHLLDTSIDLLVRTGGARTLSDFLPIELRYAQLYFMSPLFMDFGIGDLMAVCDEYERDFPDLKFGE